MRLKRLSGLVFVLWPALLLAAPTVVIPIHGEIGDPTLYIVRRGLKEAAARHAAAVLDVNTPGGRVDSAFAIVDALEQFHGRTFAYVHDEAMSAGAIVSAACDDIWFAPRGVMGAAAPVGATGEDIGATMKEKMVSYLKVRVRSAAEGKGYRAQVISAMIDPDAELTVAGQVLKARGGGLLSLTASEAARRYGQPPQPLLAAGIAATLDDLLRQALGAEGAAQGSLALELTGAEHAAVWLNRAAPVLLGIGLFCLFVAFKLSHFGGFGISGVALLGLVFFGSSVAGLSGHEPMALFAVGLILVILELLFWHSAGFLGAAGLGLMLLALVWSMADLWPGEPFPIAWGAHAFVRPLWNVTFGFLLAFGLSVAAVRYLPSGWFWDRVAIRAVVGGTAQQSSAAPDMALRLDALVGRLAVATTPLRPGGWVEVEGNRYEASVAVGAIDAGASVVIRARRDFSLVVEPAEPAAPPAPTLSHD